MVLNVNEMDDCWPLLCKKNFNLFLTFLFEGLGNSVFFSQRFLLTIYRITHFFAADFLVARPQFS